MGSLNLTVAPHETFPSVRLFKWAVVILLVYDLLELLFFAISISPYVPPDEHTHFEISRIFSKVLLFPENSPDTYAYGLVTNIPWLYYWVMGKLLYLNVFSLHDLLFLRLLNIPFAFATVYFVWRIMRLVTDDRLSQILLIVVMTNTIMFSFLSAFVSYDNLTNLLAAMAIYYLLAFFRDRNGDLLAASILCQLAGSLTKLTFLPLVLILTILLVVHELGNLRGLPRALLGWVKTIRWQRAALMAGLLITLALNVQLYGGNYVRYGAVDPEMYRVLSPDKAMHYRLAAQAMIFNEFKEGRISKEEALAMTSQIDHPGDRNETIYMIENYAALKADRVKLIGPLAYTAFWVRQMAAGTYGIFGHLQMANRGPTIWPFAALGLLTILAFALRWRPRDAGWIPSSLAAIVVLYGLFLLYGINYQIYLDQGAIGSALQGRYIFPVLGPIYVLSIYYLMQLFRNRYAKIGIALTAAMVFIYSDFPYFLLRDTPDWYIPSLRWLSSVL